jgi:hypothetical protein
VKKFWIGKKKCISVLVLAAMLVAMAATSAYGAIGIDLNQTGEITLTQQMDCTELQQQTYYVWLYKVADVNVSGKYDLVGSFDTVDLQGIESVTSETDNDTWKGYAQAAKDVVGADPENSTVTADKKIEVKNGTAEAADLALGLYLAYVPDVKTETYVYVADPLLIAVPGNNYRTKDASGTVSDNDSWRYSVTNALKFERQDLYGNLVISKTVDTLNSSLGNVSFVFQVTAKKDYAYTDQSQDIKTVYNNVVSIDFSQKRTESVTIPNIPAGAEVTVTEVYSGANYTVGGEAVQTVPSLVAETDNTVKFSNTYNDTLTSVGTAVVNHFSYDADAADGMDPWTWTEYIGDQAVNTPVSE